MTRNSYRALVIGFSLLVASGISGRQEDEILDYYVQRARATFDTRDPLERGVTYSFLATTVQWQLNREGEEQSVDSTAVRYYYSFGQLDSQVTVLEAKREIKDVDLSIPDVFVGDYQYTFFPNDSGGPRLSLGFDSREAGSKLPVGIVTIDRNLYFVRGLHMVVPEKEGYDRYSRTIETVLEDGFVFPSEVIVVAGRRGILFTEYYRRKTTVSELVITR